jgi:hypothetical protein
MAQPTITLKELRRAIGRELRMPFFRRIGAESASDASSTETKIIDAALTQKDKYWNNSFVYWIDTQTSSPILSFTANDHTLILEKSVGETPTTGDKYEIHSIWNAEDIHEAINRAIKSSRQSFFVATVDETLCIKDDVLQYDISGLTIVPWILNKIYIEFPMNAIEFIASAGAATSVTAPTGVDLTEVLNGWIVSIHDGTGEGQVRAVTNVAGQVVSVAAWTINPDASSHIAIFDPEKSSWYPLHKFHLDALEYPRYVRLTHRNPDFYGGRFRLEYLGVSNELTTEASTTIIPEEYLLNKACSLLHGQVLNGTKSDKEAHYAEFKRYQEEADAFLIRNAPHSPSILIRDPDAHVSSFNSDRADPLDWR